MNNCYSKKCLRKQAFFIYEVKFDKDIGRAEFEIKLYVTEGITNSFDSDMYRSVWIYAQWEI